MGKLIDRIACALGTSRRSALYVSLLSIVLSFFVASIVLLAMGKNPLLAFMNFLQGAGFLPKESYGGGVGILSDFFMFLNLLAPLVLASLSFIVGYKVGLFNIGISGQMVTAGFLATCLVGYSGLPAVIAKPLVIIVGVAGGALMGALVGFLKHRFNIHEVVSTIMFNYVVSYVTGFFINTYYADMMTRSMKVCSPEARLTWAGVKLLGANCNIPLGIVLAVIAALLVKFVFDKTVFGFELKAVGSNARAARYVGINVGKSVVASMVISGALAGLAGVTYYCGYFNTIQPKILPGLGYDAITVALLGNSTPIGSIFAGALIAIFQTGTNYMSSNLGVAKEIASLITGILLLFASCGTYFRHLARRRVEHLEDRKIRAERAAAQNGSAIEIGFMSESGPEGALGDVGATLVADEPRTEEAGLGEGESHVG